MAQSGGFLGRLLGRFLIKPATKMLPKLIKPAVSVGKNILAPLGLSTAMSATDAATQKKMYGSGTTALLTNKVKNEIKQQKGGFLGMLAGTLGASVLSNLLLGQGMYRADQNQGKGLFRAGQGIKKNH